MRPSETLSSLSSKKAPERYSCSCLLHTLCLYFHCFHSPSLSLSHPSLSLSQLSYDSLSLLQLAAVQAQLAEAEVKVASLSQQLKELQQEKG